MRSRLALALPLVLAAACGGTKPTSNDIAAAAPSYAALAMDQVAADAAAPMAAPLPAQALPSEVAAGPDAPSMPPMAGAPCHPHLFLRQREVVQRVNRHLYKALHHVEALLARDPVSQTETTHVWEHSNGLLRRRFTITWVADAVFDWLLEMGPAGGTLEPVLTGRIDRTGATGPHQGRGHVRLDFAALHAAIPLEPVSAGTLDVEFDTRALSRKITAVAAGMAWELDGAFFDAAAARALAAPRGGSYVYYRAPGTGGSLKIQDRMIFLCPANPALVAADAEMVSQWLKQADGSIHGRSDARVTGGQLPAGDQVVGVTCHAGVADGNDQREGFWLVKYEPAGSAGPFAGESSARLADPDAPPCDEAFGPVPTLDDRASDFTAWPDSYADGTPWSYPGIAFP